MKKIVSLLLSFILLFPAVIPAYASAITEEKREYLEDGSYFVVVVSDSGKNETEEGFFAKIFAFFRKLIEFFKGQKTVTKTKYLNYYSADNELLWTAKLKGEFIYSKDKALCTSAQFNIDIFDSDWSVEFSECREEDNTAIVIFRVKQRKLLVSLKSIEKTMTLTCDTKGNVK